MMKKRLLSVFAAAAVILGTASGISAADPADNEALLSPRAQIGFNAEGKITGITGTVTADWVASQFDGKAEILNSKGESVSGEALVPSGSTVSVDGGGQGITVTVPGDANMDGKLNLNDVSAMLKKIAMWDVVTDGSASDVDCSGKFNLSDVAVMLQYIAKWDVTIGEPALISVFAEGETEYKLLANDTATDEKLVSAIESMTGKKIEVVTEAGEGDKFITVGKDLYNKYDFIDTDAVKALEDTRAYIDTYAGNIYLTANSDNGILGCINYITNQAFTPELDMSIAKGTVGELGDLETLVRPLFNTLEIEGLKTSHRLLHVTDSHITTIYADEENDERRADVDNRLNAWIKNMFRKPSYTFLNSYFDYAENIDAEAILLTGDITDSPSVSNLDIVKDCIDNCSVPSYYIYGNHDWTWNDDYQSSTYRTMYEERFKDAVDAHDEDWDDIANSIEYDDLIIISIDNSSYTFCKTRVEYDAIISKINDAKEKGKPVILMLHIPIHTEEMHPTVDATWPGGGSLCIGEGGSCGEGSNYSNLVYEAIVAEDSPVKAIFAGHVHFNYEATVAGRIPQYVTGAAYEGYCRVVDLVPAE